MLELISPQFSWNSWNSWNSGGAEKGQRWKHLAELLPSFCRTCVVWYLHPLGCRAIDLGKLPQRGVIYCTLYTVYLLYYLVYTAPPTRAPWDSCGLRVVWPDAPANRHFSSPHFSFSSQVHIIHRLNIRVLELLLKPFRVFRAEKAANNMKQLLVLGHDKFTFFVPEPHCT